MSKRFLQLGLIMGVMLIGAGLQPRAAWGDDMTHAGSARKLGRGLANVLTFPLELLREPYLGGQADGGIAGATVGVVKGISSAVVRGGAGLVEVLTFYAPFPVLDFQPMVKPEFVFANGNWAE